MKTLPLLDFFVSVRSNSKFQNGPQDLVETFPTKRTNILIFNKKIFKKLHTSKSIKNSFNGQMGFSGIYTENRENYILYLRNLMNVILTQQFTNVNQLIYGLLPAHSWRPVLFQRRLFSCRSIRTLDHLCPRSLRRHQPSHPAKQIPHNRINLTSVHLFSTQLNYQIF